MESIRALYKVGRGPSSSHTMGPEKICDIFKEKYPTNAYKVILYGSLSLTGMGHMTDKVIMDTLPNCKVVFSSEPVEHPNTMELFAYENDEVIGNETWLSIGGGSVIQKGEKQQEKTDVYPHQTFSDISAYCEQRNMTLYEYVYHFEDKDFKSYLAHIWDVMKESIDIGLHSDGDLPGDLEVTRKARSLLYNQNLRTSNELRLVSAFAYAVSEVNASSGTVVTAPTCGASGVLPAVLYYLRDVYKFTDVRILDALATAGIIGNVVKHNASISGAEAGCQAEVGTACSMAAAAYCQLFKYPIDKIEYAAEIALEHHLGLTCDPVKGFVQVPCIERNAVGAHRAMNAAELSFLLMGSRKISFDMVVETMRQTGLDINVNYRETSEGGLAKHYK